MHPMAMHHVTGSSNEEGEAARSLGSCGFTCSSSPSSSVLKRPKETNLLDLLISTFNQIASKREGQSKTLRLLDELAAHYQTLWGLGEHP